MSFNQKEVLSDNVVAIKVLLESDIRNLSWGQIQKLKRYKGFGGKIVSLN